MRITPVVVASALTLSLSSIAQAQPTLPFDVCRALTAERVKYTAPLSPAQLGALLNDAALAVPGTRLLPKPAGNNCPQPVTGTRISCDYLVRDGMGYDVLADSENTAIVTCGDSTGPVVDSIAPVAYGDTVPPPTGSSCDLSSVLSRLMDLQASNSRIVDVQVDLKSVLEGLEATYYLVQEDLAVDKADAASLNQFKSDVNTEYKKAVSWVKDWKNWGMIGGALAAVLQAVLK
uniref:Uncharacterized protein n=1 Tax=viral metagenome TaxID=1070528 RepID=A0A6M3JQQ5_9ZZZZ